MLKIYLITYLLIVINISVFSQETMYFNNIYNPENTYGSGRGILQIENGYIGIFGTWENSSYWYKLAVFKIDLSGNMIDWNVIGEDNHDYFAGSVGGTLIKTNDGNFAFACQVQNPSTAFGKLIKLNHDLDTIWTRAYYTDNYITGVIKVKQASDGGYILVGRVIPEDGEYYNLLLMRTDLQGNKLWHQTYGGVWSENGTDVMETPDGGYLIGGYFWKPGYDHSLDAMVIKTDSLGNEEWTKYYGNPDVDDDMALVALANDGNYLVATIYGEWDYSSTYRVGRPCVFKINPQGQIIEQIKVGPNRMSNYIKNFRHVNDAYILTGFSYETDTATMALYTGWMMKLDLNLDSLWYRDYTHYNQLYDDNYVYDINICQDNGFIGIGKARPDVGGTNKMWIVKVDSMGCDTPGCATGTQVYEIPELIYNDIYVWPNPTNARLNVQSSYFKDEGAKIIRIYNLQWTKVEEFEIPKNAESLKVDVSNYHNGIYYLQYIQSGRIKGTTKFIKL